jgi:hypothetical protein
MSAKPEGYTVVPQSLRTCATVWADTAKDWTTLYQKTLPDLKLRAGDLGMLGDHLGDAGISASVIDDYNRAVGDMITTTKTGEQVINDAATKLNTSASYYEEQDYTYYQQFGYADNTMPHVPPHP